MKFYSLFRKELKEMLSLQTIITMIVTVVVLVMAGQAMSGAISDSAEKASDLTICDLDKTEFTENVLNSLKATAKAGDGKITVVDIKSDDYAAELKRLDQDSVVIIPKGFTEQVKQHKKADVGYVQRMTSLATMSNINTGSDTALAVIQQAVKSTIYQDKLSSGAMTEDEMNQLEDPVELSETTVVGDKADKVSSSVVMSLCSAQSMVVPIIMFVLIMFSAQMILSAISTEKIDKTLETLLSAPVSRLSVLASKMLAATFAKSAFVSPSSASAAAAAAFTASDVTVAAVTPSTSTELFASICSASTFAAAPPMESVCDVASISTFTSLSPSTLSVTVTFPPPNPSAVALAVLTSASAVAQAIVSTIHRLSSSAVSFFMMKNPFPF